MITVNSREEFLNEVKKLLPSSCYAIEFGVYQGDFSVQILEILKPHRLYLVDPFRIGEETYPSKMSTAYSSEDDYQILKKKIESNNEFYRAVMIEKKYSYELVNNYDAHLDFIYHDASHVYKDIKRDLNDWLPKLKKGGIMAGHDYGLADFGVTQAVDEFCQENNFEIIILNENGGDFALRKI